MIHLWAQSAIQVDDAEEPAVRTQLDETALHKTSKASEQVVKNIVTTPSNHTAKNVVASEQVVKKHLTSHATRVAAESAQSDHLVDSSLVPSSRIQAEVKSSLRPSSQSDHHVERVSQAPESKLKVKRLAEACHSGGQQCSDPVAECCRRIASVESEIRKIEEAIGKTKQELERNEEELTVYGEGPPNLNGETLEDLNMQLQLTMLEQMREIADLGEDMRTCQMSLYKLCYDAEAFPNIPAAVPSVRNLSKKPSDVVETEHRGITSATEKRTAMRNLTINPSQTW